MSKNRGYSLSLQTIVIIILVLLALIIILFFYKQQFNDIFDSFKRIFTSIVGLGESIGK